MSQQMICDECGQPINTAVPYYQLDGVKVQPMPEGGMGVVDPPVSLHYHEEHLPVYKLAGEPVEGLPANPATPRPDHELPAEPEEPQFTEDIGAMTIQNALLWADDDLAKVEYALAQERAGQNRASLIGQLENKQAQLTA